MIEKINAAKKAMGFVEEGMLLGLGSGTTVAEFIKILGKKVRDDGFEIFGISTSYDTTMLASREGITLIDPEDVDYIDLAIDGADQASKDGLVKGGGGALAREKIIAYNSKRFIVLIDERKYVKKLDYPVPIEVLPFAYPFVNRGLEKFGKPALRMAVRKLGPVITDNGNFIIDCKMNSIDKPKELEIELKDIPGVVENGIFTVFDEIIIGTKDGARVIPPSRS